MNRFWKSVLLTTLVAGTLDIISAHVDQTIRTGTFPQKIFYVIAGAAIGMKNAFSAGPGIILLGVFIHYFISFSFTLFFFVVYPSVKKLLPNKYLNAFLYAVFVQAVMTFIVLPLTALQTGPFVFDMNTIVGVFILSLVFGLPISLMTDKYYRTKAGMPR